MKSEVKKGPMLKPELDAPSAPAQHADQPNDSFLLKRPSKDQTRQPVAISPNLALGQKKATDTAWETKGSGHAPSHRVFVGSDHEGARVSSCGVEGKK
jgi:hypothetical protein